MIPKTIHQIWFQGEDKIPPHLKEYHKTWVELNPNYEVLVWDEIKIDNLLTAFPDKKIVEMYKNYKYMIQKIDLAKYIILYMYGGTYIDMDMKCLKSLDSVIKDDSEIIVSNMPANFFHRVFFTFGGYDFFSDMINNGVIITIPQHPLIYDIIQTCYKNKDSSLDTYNKSLYVFYTTGPVCVSASIHKYMRETEGSNIEILDNTYFEACDRTNIKTDDCKPPEHAIGVHIFENSWLTTGESTIVQVFIAFYRNWMYILLAIVAVYGTYRLFKSKVITPQKFFSMFRR